MDSKHHADGAQEERERKRKARNHQSKWKTDTAEQRNKAVFNILQLNILQF